MKSWPSIKALQVQLLFGEPCARFFALAFILPAFRVLPRAWAARRDAKFRRHVVALTHAARREAEPIGEDSSAFIVWIVGEQAMQAVLLFTATTFTAVHLTVFVSTLLPMHILFEWVEIQQRQDFTTSIIGPEWCNYFFFDRTSISVRIKY